MSSSGLGLGVMTRSLAVGTSSFSSEIDRCCCYSCCLAQQQQQQQQPTNFNFEAHHLLTTHPFDPLPPPLSPSTGELLTNFDSPPPFSFPSELNDTKAEDVLFNYGINEAFVGLVSVESPQEQSVPFDLVSLSQPPPPLDQSTVIEEVGFFSPTVPTSDEVAPAITISGPVITTTKTMKTSNNKRLSEQHPEAPDSKKGRGNYKCSKCRLAKKGHTCSSTGPGPALPNKSNVFQLIGLAEPPLPKLISSNYRCCFPDTQDPKNSPQSEVTNEQDQPKSSDKLELLVKRLCSLEMENIKLARENLELRKMIEQVENGSEDTGSIITSDRPPAED